MALAAGACTGKSSSTPAGPTTCTVSAGAASTTAFGPEGGQGTVPVTAAAGCAWTATSNSSFISVTGQGAQTGNGTVQFTVAANATTADRTGTMTVAGASITVTQRAVVTPPPTLAAPTAQSPSGGQTITSSRPTLVVSNAASTGNVGTITYRFEISDQPEFPVDAARTFTQDGIAQGSGTTSGIVNRDLGPGGLWFWRARATDGTITSPYSNVETFRTASPCSYTLSTTSVSAAARGGTQAVTVTTTAGCAWTATTNASFITITSGASGTDSGTVSFAVAASSLGTIRTGTLTIAGQTVTVTQAGIPLFVGFRLIDPGRGPEPRTECQIRSLTSTPTTCQLESTSFPLGTNGIVSYAWTVSYTYPSDKSLFQVGTNPNFAFTDMCGQTGSTDSGFEVFLSVTLTVTDTEGNSVTVRSDTPEQPLLKLRAYTCGI